MRKNSGQDPGPMRIRDVVLISAAILIPSWTTAYITESVVYVIPMLAVCTFILAQLYSTRSKRIDEEISKGKKGKNDHIEITGDH